MQPDRVDAPRGEAPAAPPRKGFQELLRVRADRPSRKAPGPPRRQRTATPAAAARAEARVGLTAGELRGRARTEMDTAVRRRLADGRVASTQATGRLEERAADLLHAALRTEEAVRTHLTARALATAPGKSPLHGAPEPPPTAPTVHPTAVGAGSEATGSTGVAEARVERALALVERIERFVRSGRPALAMTLRGGVGGRLELQRVAPGAITLRLSSPRPPPEGELAELRQALEARGLSVRRLESHRLTSEDRSVPPGSAVRASAADACSPSP